MTSEAKRLADKRRKGLEAAAARRARAQAFAADLARAFGEADRDLGAVIGFGSTFETWRSYRLDSDIDLALVGGDWGLLWSMIPKSDFEISLLELDAQPEEFAEQVRRNGVVLYEKQ